MLMRCQDIQNSHVGVSEICELDDVLRQINHIDEFSLPEKLGNGSSILTSEYGMQLPELSLKRCGEYTIGKDSFTEIVLLTVISYFCVSTEQRFINMNSEKKADKAETSRSQLNNSNTSQSAAGLNSTLKRSTKAETIASTGKPLQD